MPPIFSSTHTSGEGEILDFESVRAFVVRVNQYILKFLEDTDIRNSVRQRCTTKLKIQRQEFFEFSEHSVLSNLYWGIESIEAAIQAKWPEEKSSRLKSSERMLQVPALVQEHGITGGIENQYLVCCSYFYLSLCSKLQRDDWQVTLHFLHAMLVNPRLVREEFMPQLWQTIFLPHIISSWQEDGLRDLQSETLLDDATKQLARRCKDLLMYYQVLFYGETTQDEDSPNLMYRTSTSNEYLDSDDHGICWPKFKNAEKVHPIDVEENMNDDIKERAHACIPTSQQKSVAFQEGGKDVKKLGEVYNSDSKEIFGTKTLQDMLKDSQSDTSVSAYSCNASLEGSPRRKEYPAKESDSEMIIDMRGASVRNSAIEADSSRLKFHHRRFLGCISDLNIRTPEGIDVDSETFCGRHVDMSNLRGSEEKGFRLFDHISSQSLNNNGFTYKDRFGSSAKKKQVSNRIKNLSKVSLHPEKDMHMEIMRIFKKAISTLSFSEWVGQCEDSFVEVSIIWEILHNKTEARYGLLKDQILDQLLNAISTSQEERVIRASVFILTTVISQNKAVIEDIKRKGLRLCDLATALKRNVHEAAILIYLINPSPTEIKALELLPALLEVACTSNSGVPRSIQLTPLSASLMIIEVLVTAFDFTTNIKHLAKISSPPVLTRLLSAAINKNTKETISLTAILIKCMRYDEKCKSFLSQFTPMAPFVRLLRSKEISAKIIALQFFNEMLQMPRSSASSLLRQIQQSDRINTMHMLMSCIQNLEPEHQLLASNLLLQLEILEDSSGKSIFREEGIDVLLKAIASEKSSEQQLLSACILSNLGGTYAWTGEPYTAAWLIKRTGVTSTHQRNMIRNFDWSDQCLQDGSIDSWCSKAARGIIKIGTPVFHALEKGLRSKSRAVSRDCLIAISWIGCDIAKISPNDLRYSACEILLSGIEQFLHPGLDMEERLLACLSIYNYASGKGMQKLIHFSEGVRESLRRLSSITWIADELLRVNEYFLPAKSRISCVHTQILEAGYNCGVAVTALLYYMGQLCSGHSDGSIKVWEINLQTAMLIWDANAHKKEVTCFTLSEPGNRLLSGSTDKTIRVWQMVQRKLECFAVIEMKEPVCKLDSHKQFIFAITQSRGVKVFDTSRIIKSSKTVKTICKSKHVKCMAIIHGKLYIGCTDSSIQDVDMQTEREREIKAPAKRWWVQNKPINAIIGFKDWIYSASILLEGSVLKERRTHIEPQMSISMEKGKCVQTMGVVEDFLYLNCSLSTSIIEIWLRNGHRKVGRLSAGSKITSLLTANDIVLCGTETGLIKGWIPL